MIFKILTCATFFGEGNDNPLQCSCLENPRDGGSWWAIVSGSHRVRHDWSDLAAAAAANFLELPRWLNGKESTCQCRRFRSSIQFSSVTQSCPTLCHPMNRSMPGLLVHHHLLEFTQIHVHLVSDAIQPSHPLSSPSPPAPNPSQHQSLFQWVNSSHEVAKELEFQL